VCLRIVRIQVQATPKGILSLSVFSDVGQGITRFTPGRRISLSSTNQRIVDL